MDNTKSNFTLVEKIILILSGFIVIVGCVISMAAINNSEKESIEVNVDVNKLLEDASENTDKREILRFVHQLMHPLIITNDNKEWGTQVVNKENIGNALILIEYISSNLYFYDELKGYLLKMSEGNFEDAVTVHNLIWNYQGGEIGRAIKLDEEEITIITEKYFQ